MHQPKPTSPDSRIRRFLREHGADGIGPPGGTLLAHLERVADLLAVWGADEELRLAGLCHAMYGTDGFNQPLVDLSQRPTVAALIGDRAEALVYFYCSCDRQAVYRNSQPHQLFSPTDSAGTGSSPPTARCGRSWRSPLPMNSTS
ncbi:DUF6817 domain-containing protein [Nocardia terrae]|uniref:DUF6817 domain-containing protein n=1 Tax=Nocardia terrae TaxID=2675851 RepID=UPI0018E020FB|nr:hypothetical protein [Nocardia terrae]